ncbi:MAG: 2OG-Fe(II) oxygenase [Sphingomonas sp.]|nr:2OG-Fe(II) oxygenase [Sphingomonas sp.]
MEIALSAIDIAALADDYRTHGRVQVRDLLEEESAEAVLRSLHDLPWGLAYNDGGLVQQLDAATLQRLNRADAQRIVQGIHERGRRQFQFLYSYYPLFAAYFTPGASHQPVFDFYEFINSRQFIGFIRALTGNENIRWADAQATLFRSGQFLQLHRDETPGGERAAAYVINFTKDWGADWGGFLQFFDARNDVEKAFRPAFNALNIFSVPADHSVSVVAPYVQEGRYSVTGWFRTDEPPAPIGSPRS